MVPEIPTASRDGCRTTTGRDADTLRSLHDQFQEREINFLIARLDRAGREALARIDVYDEIGDAKFFLPVRAAVNWVTGEEPTRPND